MSVSPLDTRVEVVTDLGADYVIAREIARTGSDTRRALSGWMLTGGYQPGTGSGTVTNIGGVAPFTVTPVGDGTAYLEITAAGAAIEEPGDGTIVLVVQDGGTA